MKIEIATYDGLCGAEAAAARAEIRDIFFLCAARQDFADPGARDAFAARWLDYYLTEEPGRVFLARKSDGGLAGYLTGCADSGAAAPLFERIPHYALFEDRFALYPAHLHVNCRPEARSHGVGAALVAAFLAQLRAARVPGVHVVTAPEARNVAFYRRCGFQDEERRPAGSRNLLFMGKRL